MHNTGHYVRTFLLRDMQIHDLRMGPSVESENAPMDDFRYITNSFCDTDLLIMASPLNHGFISILSKIVLNRISRIYEIPSHKHFSIAAMQSKVGKAPLMGLIMQKEEGTGAQDILLNKLTVERTAANIHTVLDFCIITENGVTDAVCKTFQSVDYYAYIEKTYTDLITGSPSA